MRIDSSAPTRIDLAGGTYDIWPLYLFHRDAQTLNVALTLRAYCRLEPASGGRVALRSLDSGQRLEAGAWDALDPAAGLPLLVHLVRAFRPGGLSLETRSDSPMGAGIAGSSALAIAVCGALNAWTGENLSDDAILTIAMNAEAQAIGVPTGVQDYRPALYGGISAVELDVRGVRRVGLDVDAEALARRLVVAYTGGSRNSGINNWEVFGQHIAGDRRVFELFERIRDIAVSMRRELTAGAWEAVGALMAEEWEQRKQLAPGVSSPDIDRMIAAAIEAGAWGAKICGAGGGGCLCCLVPPDARSAVVQALERAGATLLDVRPDPRGLLVTSHG